MKVGIIGCGGIGPDHIEAYDDLVSAGVVAVSDINPATLAGAMNRRPWLRGFVDYRRMLEEIRPDVIHVCTWPQAHAQMVNAAATSGVKGILCEKPLALRVDEMEAMSSVCREHGVKLACGHQYRFHNSYIAARDAIRRGALGQIMEIRGNIDSTLANNGPHLIDTIRFLTDDRPVLQVSCVCRRERGEHNRGYPAEDSATGEITFEGGLTANIVTGDLSENFFTIRVEGTDGWLEISPDRVKTSHERLLTRVRADAFRKRQFREFICWVRGKKAQYSADGEQGMRSAEVVLALYESTRLGEPVELPLQNKGDVVRAAFDDAEPNSDEVPLLPRLSRNDPEGSLAMNGGKRSVDGWFSTSAHIGIPEAVNVGKVLLSKQLSSTDGTWVRRFEHRFASMYGSPHAVASTSGTAALHVALAAVNPEPGDEVITTPVSDMGSVIPILACNCVPVFADVDATTGILTADSIAEKITPRTKAVILVHLFGRPAELDSISQLLRERNIALIEDCAQAHLAEYKGQKVGTFGDLGCFSFQQSKQITCGDGGITLVNREDLIERASLFVDKGWDRTGGSRSHKFLGVNYRMTEMQGAVALAQLGRLPKLIEKRRTTAEALHKQLSNIEGIVLPELSSQVRPSWWIFHFNVDETILGLSPKEFCDAINVEGVRAKVGYLRRPLFHEEMLVKRNTYGSSGYPLVLNTDATPDIDDFPGTAEFLGRSLVMSWKSDVARQQVVQIAAGVRKVIRSVASVPMSAPEKNSEPVTS